MLTNRDCCIERVLFFHSFLQHYSTFFQALTMDNFNHPKPRLLSMQQSLVVNLVRLFIWLSVTYGLAVVVIYCFL